MQTAPPVVDGLQEFGASRGVRVAYVAPGTHAHLASFYRVAQMAPWPFGKNQNFVLSGSRVSIAAKP